MEFLTKSSAETVEIGKKLGAALKGGEVVAFKGGLGAGKTTFCKGIAAGLGVKEQVSSPTFAIANLYAGEITFAHFDAYRINTIEDLEAAGFYDYIEVGAVVAVEWSENISQFLPRECITVNMEYISEKERKIVIQGVSF